MEILTDIYADRNLRKYAIKGRIDIAMLIEHLKNLYSSSGFNSELNAMWDLREADFSSITSDNVRSLRDFVGNTWGKSASSKAALIVSQELDYGMSRMYQILMEDLSVIKISIFKNIDDAEKWLATD